LRTARGVVAGVPQAFDGQLAADPGLDVGRFEAGTTQGGVAAAVEFEALAGRDAGVGVGEVIAVASAPPDAGGDRDAGIPADTEADAAAGIALLLLVADGVLFMR
jgi:hypothetical protein